MSHRHAKLADGSSRRFSRPAKIVREAYRLGILRADMRVLEIGSGALRNAAWLQRRGLRVDVLEFATVVKRYDADYQRHARNGGRVHHHPPDRRFDAVLSTFVLGTITPAHARAALLTSMRDCLRAGAPLLLAVRGPGDVKTKNRAGRQWRDGFLTPNGTFIKPFRRVELVTLCNEVGLRLRPIGGQLRSNSGIVDLVLEAANE